MTPAEILERSQWDLFWLPPDVTVLDRPDLLLLTTPRPVVYLNAVLRTRSTDPRALVAEVTGRALSVTPRWMVPDTFPRGPLEAALTAAGWSPGVRHEVRVLPVDAWTGRARVEVRPVLDRDTLLDCLSVAQRAFGSPDRGWTEDSLTADLRQCRDGARVRRFVAYLEGAPASSGGLTAYPELGFGLLWGGGTVPEARGRGAYAAVLHARLEAARHMGLGLVGLYAVEHTSGPIVARQGFREEGEMWFWAPPRPVPVQEGPTGSGP